MAGRCARASHPLPAAQGRRGAGRRRSHPRPRERGPGRGSSVRGAADPQDRHQPAQAPRHLPQGGGGRTDRAHRQGGGQGMDRRR